jgi:hypothetical protein
MTVTEVTSRPLAMRLSQKHSLRLSAAPEGCLARLSHCRRAVGDQCVDEIDDGLL